MLTFILSIEFDWLNALGRFGINVLFIALMIFITARHFSLRRFAFTFLMISLIVYFLCFTLKNFDLNLGMALGLFAIFGIIRYRTEPLQTEEMTYLFVTIGMAVINALSEEFLSIIELSIINFIVLVFIVFGEYYLMKLSYTNRSHPLEEHPNRRIILHLPLAKSGLNAAIKKEVKNQEENLNIVVNSYKVFKIDHNLNIVVVHLYY